MISQQRIDAAIEQIRLHLSRGWSIESARKSAGCNTPRSSMYQAVTRDQRYVDILNNYLESKNLNMRYTLVNKKLKCNVSKKEKN
jgi:hypothetical protein